MRINFAFDFFNVFFGKVLKNKLSCRVQLFVAENMSECCMLSFYLLNRAGEGKFVRDFVPVVNLECKVVYVADVIGCLTRLLRKFVI